MHYVQYHYFLNFTFILLIWGVRTHPPCLRAYIFSAQIGIFDGRFSINCVSFTYFIRFRYLDHLDANRMAPTVCPDPIERNNVVGFKQFCTPYFRRIFGTCLWCLHIFKCPVNWHAYPVGHSTSIGNVRTNTVCKTTSLNKFVRQHYVLQCRAAAHSFQKRNVLLD